MIGELGAPSVPLSALQTTLVTEANGFLDAEFNRCAERWSSAGTLDDAEELIGLALLSDRLDDPRAERAALDLLDRSREDGARENFVRRVLSKGADLDLSLPAEEAQIRVEIAKRKRLLDLNPRDALRLAESALLYVNVGQVNSARSLLRRALILRPDDRYVLRASSRFFMHLGDPDEALYFLNASSATQSDPWLRSALFAVQATSGMAPNGWRKAKNLLTDANFTQRDLSELAVQMGSMEYEGGSRKQAIRMLRQGAQSPTENAIAQIGWVARNRSDFKNADLSVDVSLSHEASAYAAYESLQWKAAVAECDSWRRIEPFSVRPAILATFIGCVSMEALDDAATVGAYGLLANPKNKMLLNNLAAVKALQGRFDDARDLIGRAQTAIGDEDDDVVVTATAGLIDFRQGNYDAGVKKYIAAIDKALDLRNRSLAFRAACYMSREVAGTDPAEGKLLLGRIDANLELAKRRGGKIPKDLSVLRDQVATGISVSEVTYRALELLSQVKWDELLDDGDSRLLDE